MKLQQLFSFFDIKLDPVDLAFSLEQDLAGIFFDTRSVVPNSVFVAIKGTQTDGHNFLPQAITAGAIVLVVENRSKVPENFKGAILETSDTRGALDRIAAIYYDFPSHELFCFGVTGTNGKTSITYILEQILNFNHKPMAVIGTVNHRIEDKIWSSQMTTPDPVTLQRRLREFVEHRAEAAALEVTSHALHQKRSESVSYNTVVFTNLTHDHLDYHETMDHYFAAKQRLFTDLMWSSIKKPLFAVVNVDDPYGRKLQVADSVIVWTYGQRESDFQFKILKMDYAKTEFELKTPLETVKVEVPLCGLHTIYNVVASIVASLTCGISLEQAIRALHTFYGVPGRLEKIKSTGLKTVFVDYAHTPDALENVLKALVEIRNNSNKNSKIITVFGCGGDRDKAKRPIMGTLATKYSDFVYVTSDNPRTEKPEDIINDIRHGIAKNFENYVIEADREKAIAAAILRARAEDVILIAGKGHEDYQILGTEKIHFSDVEVAQKYLQGSL